MFSKSLRLDLSISCVNGSWLSGPVRCCCVQSPSGALLCQEETCIFGLHHTEPLCSQSSPWAGHLMLAKCWRSTACHVDVDWGTEVRSIAQKQDSLSKCSLGSMWEELNTGVDAAKEIRAFWIQELQLRKKTGNVFYSITFDKIYWTRRTEWNGTE